MVFWEKLCWCWEGAEKGSCKASLITTSGAFLECIPQSPLFFASILFAKEISAWWAVHGPFITCIFKLHPDQKCLNRTAWKHTDADSLDCPFPLVTFTRPTWPPALPLTLPLSSAPGWPFCLLHPFPFHFLWFPFKRGAWWAMAFS